MGELPFPPAAEETPSLPRRIIENGLLWGKSEAFDIADFIWGSVEIALENTKTAIYDIVDFCRASIDIALQDIDALKNKFAKRIISFIPTKWILKFHTGTQKIISNLQQLATTDPLTGLENKRVFEEAFRRRLAHFKRLCTDPEYKKKLVLLFFDLDNFKLINDTYGHQEGDKCLIIFSRYFKENISRRPEDHVARIGGDEFASLMEDVPEGELEALQKHLRTQLDNLELEHGIRVSVGIRIISREDMEFTDPNYIDRFLRHADEAMYAAKATEIESDIHVWTEQTPELPEKSST